MAATADGVWGGIWAVIVELLPLGALAALFSWLWGEAPFLLPLIAWAVVALWRASQAHVKRLSLFENTIDALTKSGDLRAALPSSAAQRRLRLLLDDQPGERKAMQQTERLFGRWFGPALLSPMALDRMLVGFGSSSKFIQLP